MAVGIWSVTTDVKSQVGDDRFLIWNPTNGTAGQLIGSTFSVVAYKSIQNFPSAEPRLVSSNDVISVGGCAAL